MVGSGLHQENPRQADPQLTEPVGFQRQGNFPGPKHEQNQENEGIERGVCIPPRRAKATPK